MLTDQDVLTINEGMLRACLTEHAKRGFSGELEFEHESLGLLTARSDVHVDSDVEAPIFDPDTWIEHRWPSLRGWLKLPNAGLTVFFRLGRITKSQIRSETPRR